jgi:hypothetical protein
MARCHNLAAPETTIDVIGKVVGLVVVVVVVVVVDRNRQNCVGST